MDTTKTIQERLASGEGVALVKEWLRDNKGKGRVALARHVCERLEMRDARGSATACGKESP
jgi:hypothetical protein